MSHSRPDRPPRPRAQRSPPPDARCRRQSRRCRRRLVVVVRDRGGGGPAGARRHAGRSAAPGVLPLARAPRRYPRLRLRGRPLALRCPRRCRDESHGRPGTRPPAARVTRRHPRRVHRAAGRVPGDLRGAHRGRARHAGHARGRRADPRVVLVARFHAAVLCVQRGAVLHGDGRAVVRGRGFQHDGGRTRISRTEARVTRARARRLRAPGIRRRRRRSCIDCCIDPVDAVDASHRREEYRGHGGGALEGVPRRMRWVPLARSPRRRRLFRPAGRHPRGRRFRPGRKRRVSLFMYFRECHGQFD